jgi:streptolysin S family bacteriocin protoxin
MAIDEQPGLFAMGHGLLATLRCNWLTSADNWRVQLMALGGNQRARQYFKQHGWYEQGADKIEQKVCVSPQRCCVCIMHPCLEISVGATAELLQGSPGMHSLNGYAVAL